MLKMEDFFMISDLHHQGLNISQISHKTGLHRNTVRKYVTAQTSPAPVKRRDQPSILDPFKGFRIKGSTGITRLSRTTYARFGPKKEHRQFSGMRQNPEFRLRSTGGNVTTLMRMNA